ALIVKPASLPGGIFMAWESNWLGSFPLGALAFLFLLFPTGHLPSPRWRVTAWLIGVAFALEIGSPPRFSTLGVGSPFSQSGNSFSPVLFVLVFLLPIAFTFVAALVAVIQRFRRARGEERQQLKWFAAGATLVVLTLFMTIPSSSPVFSVLQSLSFILLW